MFLRSSLWLGTQSGIGISVMKTVLTVLFKELIWQVCGLKMLPCLVVALLISTQYVAPQVVQEIWLTLLSLAPISPACLLASADNALLFIGRLNHQYILLHCKTSIGPSSRRSTWMLSAAVCRFMFGRFRLKIPAQAVVILTFFGVYLNPFRNVLERCLKYRPWPTPFTTFAN